MLESGLDPGISSDTIRSELDRVLASPEFRASKRCQDFLAFVVERTLAGLPDSLKERTIGIEVFGRPTSYDTSVDGIVRINASEVRKRLAIYYADPGKIAQYRIGLPVGSYVPVFAKAGSATHAHGDPSHATETSGTAALATSVHGIPIVVETHRPSRARLHAALFTAAIIVAAIGSIAWLESRPAKTIVDQFWQPLFDGPNPILIVPAYVPVYSPASETPAYLPGTNTLIPVPNTHAPTPNGPFTLLTDQYVGGGDLVAAFQLSSMLMQQHHPVNLRMNEGVTLDDLRNTPTVLIGYSSTQWSDVTNKFRFFVDDATFGMIRDNGKPTEWYPHHETPQHHTDEDYAVISRAFDPETHSMLILVSGCLQYGTEGAARLIASPEQLSAALHDAPKDWQKKNIQLVIHFDVVQNSPASSKVVASYYW